MVEDIVKEYALRLYNGTREFKYIKLWPYKGSFMSAAYTQGDCMKAEFNSAGYNTTLQSQEDIDRFTELVCKELKEKHGIEIKDSLVEYRGNFMTGWHHMRFELVLTLTE